MQNNARIVGICIASDSVEKCYDFSNKQRPMRQYQLQGNEFVYSIVNEDDMVPRLNVKCVYGAMDCVCECE